MELSIRFRLTLWYVGALALTLILLGVTTHQLTRVGLEHWLDETLGERAEKLSEEARLVEGRPRLDLPEYGHGGYEGVSDGFVVLDGAGQVTLARGLPSGTFAQAQAVGRALTGWPTAGSVLGRDGHRWRIAAHPILAEGHVAAVVLVAHDQREMEEVLGRLALVMAALLPLGLIGAAGGGYLLAGRALAPVDQMTRTAAAITEQNLSGRLPAGPKDELGRLAATFNALIERLQRALERQRRFTADASHELRTPLSIIQATTSQKLLRAREPDEYVQALRQIDETAGYMGRLVAQLLTLARADTGQGELLREQLDLVELVGHVGAHVGETSGRVIPVKSEGTLVVSGDPLRLTQLFLNVLDNAAKYTPASGKVEVEMSAEGARAVIHVRDEGVGIPPEHLPHIFDRFYRVDRARARDEGGTGLGLSIAQWVVEMHAGTIRAESEPGRGTTLTVSLPLASGEQNA